MMKKPYLIILTAISCANPVSAKTPLYGRLDISAESVDAGKRSAIDLTNNSSRLGIKGTMALYGSTNLIYQLEYGMDLFNDNEAQPFFTQRDIYLGLKGGWGAVMAGKLSTPLKSVKSKVDLFNDHTGELKRLITNSNNRNSNTLFYSSPVFAQHFTLATAVIAKRDDHGNPAYSTSLSYSNKHEVAIAFDRDVEKRDVEVLRIVNRYRFDRVKLGAFYEYQWGSDSGMADGDAWLISVQYSLAKLAIKAQAGRSEIHQNLDILRHERGKTFSFGIDYRLAESTTLFGYFSREQSTEHSVDDYYLGVGVQFNFSL